MCAVSLNNIKEVSTNIILGAARSILTLEKKLPKLKSLDATWKRRQIVGALYLVLICYLHPYKLVY